MMNALVGEIKNILFYKEKPARAARGPADARAFRCHLRFEPTILYLPNAAARLAAES